MVTISNLRDPKSVIGKTLRGGVYPTYEKKKVELAGDGRITHVQYNFDICDNLCFCITLSSRQTFYFKTTESLPIQ